MRWNELNIPQTAAKEIQTYFEKKTQKTLKQVFMRTQRLVFPVDFSSNY